MVKKAQKLLNENLLAVVLIIGAVLLRLLPHPANFAPITAMALFGGTYLKKKQALWLPLVAMIVSDAFLGLHNLVLFTWGSFLVVGLIGLWLKKNKGIANTIVATLTSSFLFFFVTNLAVWKFTPLYPQTVPGLVRCFEMAIPFFRNTITGDLFYVGVLFGAYELAASFMFSKKEAIIIK